jgi:hypothetical protein
VDFRGSVESGILTDQDPERTLILVEGSSTLTHRDVVLEKRTSVSWCSAVMESCRGEVLVLDKTNNLNSQFLFYQFL